MLEEIMSDGRNAKMLEMLFCFLTFVGDWADVDDAAGNWRKWRQTWLDVHGRNYVHARQLHARWVYQSKHTHIFINMYIYVYTFTYTKLRDIDNTTPYLFHSCTECIVAPLPSSWNCPATIVISDCQLCSTVMHHVTTNGLSPCLFWHLIQELIVPSLSWDSSDCMHLISL